MKAEDKNAKGRQRCKLDAQSRNKTQKNIKVIYK